MLLVSYMFTHEHNTISIAIENDDYDPGPYNITVVAGEIRTVFNISIISDDANEGTENFSVAISSINLHLNISAGSISTATVSIVDDIGKLNDIRMHICY